MNETEDESDERSPIAVGVILGIFLSILSVATVFGNTLVINAVYTNKRLRTVNNMYLVSLAFADLIVGLVAVPINIPVIITEVWHFGTAACYLWVIVDYSCCLSSILHLLILCLDRYWSVTQPLRYLHTRTKRRALQKIACAWTFAILWVSIPAFWWTKLVETDNQISEKVFIQSCKLAFQMDLRFNLATATVVFYLPFTIMCIANIRIFNVIKKSSQNPALGRKRSQKSPQSREMQSGGGNSHFTKQATMSTDEDKVSIQHPQIRRERSASQEFVKIVSSKEKNKIQQKSVKLIKAKSSDDLTQTVTKRERKYFSSSIQINGGCRKKASRQKTLPEESSELEQKQKDMGTHSFEVNSKIDSDVDIECSVNEKTSCLDVTVRIKAIIKSSEQTNSNNEQNAKAKRRKFTISKKKSRDEGGESNRKAAIQLSLVMGCFMMCWMPIFTQFIVYWICDCTLPPEVLKYAILLGYVNSMLNPVIYSAVNVRFRNAFKESLRKLWANLSCKRCRSSSKA